MKTRRAIRATALAVAIATASGAVLAQSDELYRGHATPEGLIFEPLTEQSLGTGVDLVITGPGDFVFTRSYEPGMLIEFRPDTHRETAFPDGSYRYELTVRSIQGLQRSRDRAGSGAFPSLSGGSGSFTIVDGKIADPSLAETAEPKQTGGESVSSESSKSRAAPLKFGETIEQFISGDLTVHFSLCVGGDCATSETFGADTIRLKENNLRIHFDDTSNSASFPRTDWRIIANDQANGGLSRFSIEDASAGRIPFTIEANAPSNSLYVEDGGRVGFGTSTPVVELHTKDGDTPTLRLEQDGSSGFAAQTWDVAGNETNFFIRDVTNGSRLPFKIRASAPTDSMVIAASGNLGLGVASPTAALHIRATDGTSDLLLEETQASPTNIMFNMNHNGNPGFGLTNTESSASWQFRLGGSGATEQFLVSKVGSGNPEFAIFADGDVQVLGTLTTGGPTCGTGCDAVFEETYTLDSLAAHSDRMWELGHLPAVGPTEPHAPFNMTEKLGNMLHELEKAHIFIDLLAYENAAKERSLDELRVRNRELESRLDRLEEMVQVLTTRSAEPDQVLAGGH